MNPGWNPTRRNRKIGTAAQGHGDNNQLVIPQSWHRARNFYEHLPDCRVHIRHIGYQDLTFLIEPPKKIGFIPVHRMMLFMFLHTAPQ